MPAGFALFRRGWRRGICGTASHSLALESLRSGHRIYAMHLLLRFLAAMALVLFFSGCGTSRSAFAPESGPPTVGMPAELSERERAFVPGLETALRDRGYLPVRYGAGDMQLKFEMAEGPINTDTTIELYEGRRLLAKGFGRGSGAPMVGRSKVAERSFTRAFEEFQSSLQGASPGGFAEPGPAGSHDEYVY